jgi:hypothetical protein
MAAMTEEEWLKNSNLRSMVEFIGENASDRKLRLFVVACCRRKWNRFSDHDRATIELAERYADGKASVAKLATARDAAGFRSPFDGFDGLDGLMVRDAVATAAFSAAQLCSCGSSSLEDCVRAILLRCIVGNPFRPVSLGLWITPAAATVAQDTYDRRDFAALPVLADLLEEAGCPEQSVLDHCRNRGLHARGCWVVDLVLGKS